MQLKWKSWLIVGYEQHAYVGGAQAEEFPHDIEKGKFSYVFVSPESVLSNERPWYFPHMLLDFFSILSCNKYIDLRQIYRLIALSKSLGL